MAVTTWGNEWHDHGNNTGWTGLKQALTSFLPDKAYIEDIQAFKQPDTFSVTFMVAVIFYHGQRHVIKCPAENNRYFPTSLFKAKIGLLA